MTRCCVVGCSKIGTHRFPKDTVLLREWLKAIRRKKFVPSSATRLCGNHFVESDYVKQGKYSGSDLQHKCLIKGAVPSVFPWTRTVKIKATTPTTTKPSAREERLQNRNLSKRLFPRDNASITGPSIEHNLENAVPTAIGRRNTEQYTVNAMITDTSTCMESYNFDEICINEVEVVAESHSSDTVAFPSDVLIHTDESVQCNKSTQTSNLLRLFSTELLYTDDEAVMYYTGLKSYAKFNIVLLTLMPMANDLKYRWNRVVGLSNEDQFLILLIKLRCNKPDYEISKMFGISKTEVSNVFVTWANFVHDMWSQLHIWPSRELVNFYMPEIFKKYHRTTRLIIDGTEIPIQKPGQPNDQRASFSQYKHKNTLKFLVGSSPGGFITYCSGAFAGSASDRQIVERSTLLQSCQQGDSIMADRGFNVQDIFASKGVAVNIPTFLKGKSQLPVVLLKKDQQLARQRVHIERLIGLTKTYKILTSELNHFYVPLASKIFFICIMLCNFRERIVPK